MNNGNTYEEIQAQEAFLNFYKTIKRLRAPGGCPWDREQTPKTLRGALIEETYECIEAIDSEDTPHIKEELGDVFLVAVMLSYMHEEAGKFSVASVLEDINKKLIRRHPHVFGEIKVKDSDEVLKNWDKIKIEKEGRKGKNTCLDEVPRSVPPLFRAFKMQKKAAKSGFDWDGVSGVMLKLEEELNEVKEAMQGGEGDNKNAIENEIGDLLFSVINLSRFLSVDPSVALQKTNIKFYNRFSFVEASMKEKNIEMKKENIKVMEDFWNKAKVLNGNSVY